MHNKATQTTARKKEATSQSLNLSKYLLNYTGSSYLFRREPPNLSFAVPFSLLKTLTGSERVIELPVINQSTDFGSGLFPTHNTDLKHCRDIFDRVVKKAREVLTDIYSTKEVLSGFHLL